MPQPEGKVFTLEETSSSSSSNEIRSFEDIELNSPDLIRGVRNPDNNLEVIPQSKELVRGPPELVQHFRL